MILRERPVSVGQTLYFKKCERGCPGCSAMKVKSLTFGKGYEIKEVRVSDWSWGRIKLTNDKGATNFYEAKHFEVEP